MRTRHVSSGSSSSSRYYCAVSDVARCSLSPLSAAQSFSFPFSDFHLFITVLWPLVLLDPFIYIIFFFFLSQRCFIGSAKKKKKPLYVIHNGNFRTCISFNKYNIWCACAWVIVFNSQFSNWFETNLTFMWCDNCGILLCVVCAHKSNGSYEMSSSYIFHSGQSVSFRFSWCTQYFMYFFFCDYD